MKRVLILVLVCDSMPLYQSFSDVLTQFIFTKTNFMFVTSYLNRDRPQCEAAKERQLQNIAVTSRKLFPGLPKIWYYESE